MESSTGLRSVYMYSGALAYGSNQRVMVTDPRNWEILMSFVSVFLNKTKVGKVG